MAEDSTNIPDVSMAEVEAVLTAGDSEPKEGLTRAVLLGRAVAAAENKCTSMHKEPTLSQDDIKFLQPLLRIISKLLCQVPESTLSENLKISAVMLKVVGSIVATHYEDCANKADILDASLTIAISSINPTSAVDQLDAETVYKVLVTVAHALETAMKSGDGPAAASCWKALLLIVSRSTIGFTVVSAADHAVNLLSLLLKCSLDVLKQKKASRNADSEYSSLRWLALVASATDFDKSVVKAIKSATKTLQLAESKSLANDVLSFATLMQRVHASKYKLPNSNADANSILLVGGDLSPIQAFFRTSETPTLDANDDFESVEVDVSKCKNGLLVVNATDHGTQFNLKVCARIRMATKFGASVACVCPDTATPPAWITTLCHAPIRPIAMVLGDDDGIAVALKPFCRTLEDQDASTAADTAQASATPSKDDAPPSTAEPTPVVSLEEFRALQDQVTSQAALIDALQTEVQERIHTTIKALLQPLEQRLTASEARAGSLEKDLIDSQSEIARLDAMLYKQKASGGGGGSTTAAESEQSPTPARSKVTSPSSEGRAPKPGELSARSQMAAVMRGNMLAGMRKGNVAPAPAEDVHARPDDEVPPSATAGDDVPATTVAVRDGDVAAVEESSGDRASTLHEVFGEES
eukprot:m.282531 g.282531  ORF g.282531 m.282531 type:complete len:641 (-) comp19853_c0_seq2:203-2125(-)